MVELTKKTKNMPITAKEVATKPNIADQIFPNETPWDEIINPKTKKKKSDLPDHIIRILAIMWLNSHTRAKKQKQYSTETETYRTLTKWLEDHPV